jgi:23S rRNA pseudouridine2605 synthase
LNFLFVQKPEKMTQERLQKILARAGYGSRRSAEGLIEAGRVTVNGQVAQIGGKADAARDAIKVDGARIGAATKFEYYAVYKPRGVISTTGGPEPRAKVVDLVPGGRHMHLVGRLDLDSEGLMLLTNDGELTQRVSHPRFEQEKEYRVLLARHPSSEQLDAWRRGVVLEDGTRTRPAEVRVETLFGKGAWLRVVMHEGHKRQIREVATTLGLPVVKLIRVRIASLRVGSLKPGDYRALTEDEVTALKLGEKPKPVQLKQTKRPASHKRPTRSHARPSAGSKRPFKPNKPFRGNTKRRSQRP